MKQSYTILKLLLWVVIPCILFAQNPDATRQWESRTLDFPVQSVNEQEPLFQSPLSESSGLQQTSWQWLSPLPQGNALRGLAVISDKELLVCGDKGVIVKSVNAGETWQVNNANSYAFALNALYFSNSLKGVAAGSFYHYQEKKLKTLVLETENGGISWQRTGFETAGEIKAISFSRSTGVLAGKAGLVYLSTDAGSHWQKMSQVPVADYESVFFVDSMHIYLAGSKYNSVSGLNDGFIARSVDGGNSWTSTTIAGNYKLYAIKLYDSSNGYAVGERGKIVRTSDAGQTWSAITSAGVSQHLYALYIANASDIIICGQNGTVLKTTNGGTSWKKLHVGLDVGLYSMAFISPQNGYIAGQQGLVFSTTDAGETWKNLCGGIPDNINDVRFYTAEKGVAVSSVSKGGSQIGGIYTTTDGGVSWKKSISIPDTALRTLEVISENNWVAGGDRGYILRTTNAGQSWLGSTTAAFYSNRGIAFPSPLIGFVSARTDPQGGKIFKTIDGGINWTTLVANADDEYWNVAFRDSLNGIVAGVTYDLSFNAHGLIVTTSDGGNSWNRLVLNDVVFLKDVCILDSATAIAVGTSICKTTDAGATWIRKNTNALSLNRVHFIDHENGVAVGPNGLVVRTTDAGEHWYSEQTVLSTQSLESVHYVRYTQGYVGYIAGQGGSLVVSVVSPMTQKTWTWAGSQDSSWNNPANWIPVGLPLPGDSVVVPLSSRPPVIYIPQQQIVIGALTIQSGGKLSVTDSLKRFAILGDVVIKGTLQMYADAQTSILAGGSWVVQTGKGQAPMSDAGFIPGLSTVYFNAQGALQKNFYNLVIDSTSQMRSSGSIAVTGKMLNKNLFNLNAHDTLSISNAHPQALDGTGIIRAGTVKRKVQGESSEPYQFESRYSFFQFTNSGKGYTNPPFVQFTTYPDTIADEFGNYWVELPSAVDTVNNVVVSDSVTKFTTFFIGYIDKKNVKAKTRIKRVYTSTAGSNEGNPPAFRLSLRYNQNEVTAGIVESKLKILSMIDSMQTVPIAPQLLRGERSRGKIQLFWKDKSFNELGFLLFRKTGDSLSGQQFFIVDTIAKQTESFTDTTIIDTMAYTYKIAAYNNFGISDTSNQIVLAGYSGISRSPVPDMYYLEQNYPNPFNGSTVISFGVKQTGRVHLALYDVTGRLLTVLRNEILSPGRYESVLQFSDGKYGVLASGLYFYRLEIISGGEKAFVQTRKLIYLK